MTLYAFMTLHPIYLIGMRFPTIRFNMVAVGALSFVLLYQFSLLTLINIFTQRSRQRNFESVEKIRRMKKEYKSIMNNLPEGIAVLDQETKEL